MNGTNYLQIVPLWEYHPNREGSNLTINGTSKEEKFHFPEAYGQFPENVDLSGPLVFAGYGITAPELNYDDYKGIDASGKVVLIFDHEPQETDEQSIFNGLAGCGKTPKPVTADLW